jgi:NADH-quinone oxidoreductase subunit L
MVRSIMDSLPNWEPFYPGLVIMAPFLGFMFNGMLSLYINRPGIKTTSQDISRSKKISSVIGPGSILVSFVVVAINGLRMFVVEHPSALVKSYWTWIETSNFVVEAAIQVDSLSLVMMTVITGVGFLIHIFSMSYMENEKGYARYFAYLNLFVFFMLVLVMGSSYPIMFVGWEGVGLCSYLLIGYWFEDEEKASAGKKAFIVNRIGDLGFLLGIFLLYGALGAVDYQTLAASASKTFVYGGGWVTLITLFFLLAGVGKSAQIPLFVWLPDAMAGPTPVSALIHAATMVTAGIYLIVRSSILYSLAPLSSAIVAGIGVCTAFFAATIACKQYDIKKVLAYSTISQLGYMFLGVGVGAYTAGVFHLVTHAFFKALLFLGAGAVIHSMHHALHKVHSGDDPQDMRNMGGLRKFMPITCVLMWVATLAISGVWPFSGFFSKDEIIWMTGSLAMAESSPFPLLYKLYWSMALLTALLTAFYMTRFMVMTFHGKNRTTEGTQPEIIEAPKLMLLPLMVLGFLSLFGGWINVTPDLMKSAVGGFGFLPMTDWLHHWLEPVISESVAIQLDNVGELGHQSPAGGGEVSWALISTAAAICIVTTTIYRMSKNEVRSVGSKSKDGKISQLLYNKWYVDELYDQWIVRPLWRISHFCWKKFDQGLIDRAVNFSGRIAKGIGWFGSLFHTGQVNTYAFFLTLGLLAALIMVMS